MSVQSSASTAVAGLLGYSSSWTTRRLILRLNDIILGWGLYHKYLCSPEVFADLDDWVQSALWMWAHNRWTEKSASWIYAHHWKVDTTTMRKEFSSAGVKLIQFSEIIIKTDVVQDVSKNPYIDFQYFRERERTKYEFQKIREGDLP